MATASVSNKMGFCEEFGGKFDDSLLGNALVRGCRVRVELQEEFSLQGSEKLFSGRLCLVGHRIGDTEHDCKIASSTKYCSCRVV